MTTDVKRQFHDILGMQDDDDESKKLHTKPGRKPIETEPKLKRTAQNRAAQRAYRERKEKKMKDLEDKVKDLEDENVRVNTESDFLKAQVDMLKNELLKYRGGSEIDFLSIKLPTKVGKLSSPTTGNNTNNTTTSSESDNSSINNSSPDTEVSNNELKTEFPWDSKNFNSSLNSFSNSNSNSNRGNSNSGMFDKLPDLVSGSSSSTSPLNDNILLDNDSKFEENVDPFCNELNSACGRKDNLMAKYKNSTNHQKPFSNSNNNTPNNNNDSNNLRKDSIFGNYFDDSENFLGTNNFDYNLNSSNTVDNDPLSFLNDNNFDVNIAFDENKSENVSPIDNLISEESAYDPLKDQINTNFNFNDFIKSSLPSEPSTVHTNSSVSEIGSAHQSYTNNNNPHSNTNNNNDTTNDENEVVPAPEKTYKCSEIWDRITSHPRYTSIDIDGLCAELKSKAKCSEKGVVINANDVNALLEASAKER